jgi:hypothetical protein
MTEVDLRDQDVLGPVAYLVVEFPGNKMTGEGLVELIDLVDRGVIRVLDLVFVMKEEDGTIRAAEVQDFDGDGEATMALFEGASSGLLDDDDLAKGGDVLQPGSAAAMLIYENRWAAPFVSALRGSGAELVAAGFIPQDAILASLDAVEANA